MQQFRKWFSAVLAAVLLFLVLPTGAVTRADSKTYLLPVFETTDVHGHLVDTSSGDAAQYEYRMAYIAKTISAARTDGDRATTVVLDGGDIYQGNVVSNLQDGKPLVEAYDAIGYDAVALGNHEFDWGVTNTCDPDGTMTNYVNAAGETVDCLIPVLCCDLFETSSGKRASVCRDYVLLNKTATAYDGTTRAVTIAVIGYAGNYASDIMPSEFAAYYIDASASRVTALASTLKAEGADAVIVLAHNGAASTASMFAGSAVDLVLGGHSHTNTAGYSGDLAYMQAGAKATTYGQATLTFTNGKVDVVDPHWTSVGDCTAAALKDLDPTVYAISTRAVAGVADTLSAVLGYVTQDVQGVTAGNFVCDLYNRATGSLVGVNNGGGIRRSFLLADGSDKRSVTKGDIYTMLPFDNQIYVFRVSYKTLFDTLSRDYNYMYGVDLYSNALVINGECVYLNGAWATGWQTATTLVAVNEYVSTSNSRFTAWIDAGYLVDSVSYVDNVCAIDALAALAAQNDGYIPTDTENHRHSGSYAGSLTTLLPEVNVLAGDADCSGAVNAADAAAILRYMVKLDVLGAQALRNADVDGKAGVTAADAAVILRYTVKLEAVLPVA